MNAKVEMRAHLRAEIDQLDPQSRVSYNQQISERLAQLLSSCHCIGSYSPLKDEVNISQFNESMKAQVCYPRTEEPSDASIGMSFFKAEGAFERSALGVLEPKTKAESVAQNLLEAVVVPGRGFDRRGMRLGRGKGYYDRFLKSFKGTKVGVGYSSQVCDKELPRDEWDVPMDFVVTENYILQTVRK